MEKITRSEAKAKSLKRYFTGKPCKHGHVTDRFVSSGACLDCATPRRQKWQEENKEKVAARKSVWYSKNRIKAIANSEKWRKNNMAYFAEKSRAYRKKNLEKEKARQAKWLAENPEKMKAINADWYARNPDKANRRTSLRRARKLKATVGWDSELTQFATMEAFQLALSRSQSTGFCWHVDHMLPLKSTKVCGLHVWSNFQVIPEWMNLRKNNRLWFTLPGQWIMHA